MKDKGQQRKGGEKMNAWGCGKEKEALYQKSKKYGHNDQFNTPENINSLPKIEEHWTELMDKESKLKVKTAIAMISNYYAVELVKKDEELEKTKNKLKTLKDRADEFMWSDLGLEGV